MEPHFFKSGLEMRHWLERNHASARELVVGFYRTSTGKPSLRWAESVDEALCFGWIDGIRKGRNAESYTIRFTPRKARSTWSAVNIRRVAELEAMGRMQEAGRAAFARRQESRSRIYSYEQPDNGLSPEFERRFKGNRRAWTFFEAQPPSYRRVSSYWVMSAKQPQTRERRLNTLINDSANGRRIAPLSRS